MISVMDTRGCKGNAGRSLAVSRVVLLLTTLLMAMAAHARTDDFATIYTFGPQPDGTDPNPGFVKDKSGNIYGGTYLGGTSDDGIVCQLSPPAVGQTAWTETILYDFGAQGQYPITQIGIDPDGALYITTYFGGKYGGGILLKLAPPALGQTTWTPTVLHEFGGSDDVGTPLGIVVGRNGDIYGEAKYGGSSGEGGVFLVKQNNRQAKEAVIYSFTESDGPNYYGTLARGAGDVIYGTSPNGGRGGLGLVYALSPPSIPGQPWIHTVIHNFSGGTGDGSQPATGVALDRRTGIVYGTTVGGGTDGLGVVFSLTPPTPGSNQWQESILHNFSDTKRYIGFQFAGITLVHHSIESGRPPTIWGVSSTTLDGHEPSKNVVFSLEPKVDNGTIAWKIKIQHTFDIKVDGWALGNLLEYNRNTLIGVTRGDEESLFGTVYTLTHNQ